MTKNYNQSLISIDLARGFAALNVFYYHQHSGATLATLTGLKFLNFTDAIGALYAVPLFFLISGYCIHTSNLKFVETKQSLPLKEYYKRRFLRIYPPYLVAILFSIVINCLNHTAAGVNWTDVWVHIFLLQGISTTYFNTINVVLWTITIEMLFYIIYPLFYYIRLKISLKIAVAFAFSISCISILYFSGKPFVTPPQQYFVLNLWFAWCCGAWLADKIAFNATDLKKPAYKILYGLILILFIFQSQVNMIIAYQIKILFCTGPLFFLISKEYWFKSQRSFLLKIFACIGLSSYSLYLFHEPLIYLKNFLVHEYLPQRLQRVGVFAGIFVIPIVTWFCYLYIEKPFISRKRKMLMNG